MASFLNKNLLRLFNRGTFLFFFLLPLSLTAQKITSSDFHSLPQGKNHLLIDTPAFVPESNLNLFENKNVASSDATVSPSDLRLNPILPGPRYLDGSDFYGNRNNGSGLMHTIGTRPGYAFLASALLPGMGQAANRQWWKTAFFAGAEATLIGIFIHRENRGRDGERYYEKFGDEYWSVVKYAHYITNIHSDRGPGFDFEFEDLLTDYGKDIYDKYSLRYGDNIEKWPIFDTAQDWRMIDIEILRRAERKSLYANNNAFSHDLPDFGSQQYYELISKYFQFAPGWMEWDAARHGIERDNMPEEFWYHAQIGYDFNHDLGVARNMLTLLVANHFVAAFDAYFTQKIRNARVSPTASMEYGLRPSIGFKVRI